MNEIIIKRHNNIINKHEKVFILGDFSLDIADNIRKIIKRLNGYKILIMGNHDLHRSYKAWYEYGFNEVYKYPIILNTRQELEDEIEEDLILSHEPLLLSHEPVLFKGEFINIHGHIHSQNYDYLDNWNKHLCVSLERTNYYPIKIKELLKIRKIKMNKRSSYEN